ncbi:MAG TPA: hypothetical protein VNG90_03375 [Candidatus Acidoferrum sp.]|nr:hypothetical protein [Candidatus Acidoferrum sp.]
MIILLAALLFIVATIAAALLSSLISGTLIWLVVQRPENGSKLGDILSFSMSIALLIIMFLVFRRAYAIWWMVVQSLR